LVSYRVTILETPSCNISSSMHSLRLDCFDMLRMLMKGLVMIHAHVYEFRELYDA
jgi:hypothetical protein